MRDTGLNHNSKLVMKLPPKPVQEQEEEEDEDQEGFDEMLDFDEAMDAEGGEDEMIEIEEGEDEMSEPAEDQEDQEDETGPSKEMMMDLVKVAMKKACNDNVKESCGLKDNLKEESNRDKRMLEKGKHVSRGAAPASSATH